MTHTVERHKTAITRYELSKPVSLALQHNIINKNVTFFDYGCGRGRDVLELTNEGHAATGWDPIYYPTNEKCESDIVNLGYVINVIEKQDEREGVLKDAFTYAKKCLIVAAQVLNDGQKSKGTPFADGILTQKKTFQKYYTQKELKEYIEQTLGIEPIAACPGIYYIFKDSILKEEFIATRYLRAYIARHSTNIPLSEKLKPHLQLLEEFANLVGNIGRLPKPDEVPFFDELQLKVGGIKKCATYCEKLFDNFNLENIQKNKRDDLLVFLAMSNFSGGLKLKHLPLQLQRDIKGIFGSFNAAIETATDLLFAVGKPEIVSQACAKSSIGKLLPDSLYVHTSYINSLSPILRIFIGCGTVFAGDISDATLIKINRVKSKLSYLYYEKFDEDPHPKLKKSIVLDLKNLEIKEWIQSEENPPILHRKELFVNKDYHLYSIFYNLTTKEEEEGLLTNFEIIGRAQSWEKILRSKGFSIINHNLNKISDY